MNHQSDSVKEISIALSKAQEEMPNAELDKVNPHFKSKYASLPALRKAITPSLSKYGLSITQTYELDNESRTCLRTTLRHSSGEWITGVARLNPVKDDPQGMGSATTYYKRQSLSAMTGVIGEEDDDGNSTSHAPFDSKNKVSASPAKAPRENLEGPVAQKAVAGPAESYVVQFGKYKGMALHVIPRRDLENYCNYLVTKSHDESKPIQGVVEEFLNQAEEYLTKTEEPEIPF